MKSSSVGFIIRNIIRRVTGSHSFAMPRNKIGQFCGDFRSNLPVFRGLFVG